MKEAANDGKQDIPSAPYNAEHLVYFGAMAVRERITASNTCGCTSAVRHVPRTVSDWANLLKSADVQVVPIPAEAGFTAILVQDDRVGWVCYLSCLLLCWEQRRVLCEKYCEWMMTDCFLLGRGCPEAFDLPNATIRAGIAKRVADELC